MCPAEASRALGHFFSKANLSALREMALRKAAQSVDQAMLEHLDANAVPGVFGAGERVLVAVGEMPGADALVRAAKRLADALKAPWQAIYIETPRAERLQRGTEEAARRRAPARGEPWRHDRDSARGERRGGASAARRRDARNPAGDRQIDAQLVVRAAARVDRRRRCCG